MADGVVRVAPDSSGKMIDTAELTVGANTVERQRMVVADNATAVATAAVQNTAPVGTEYGLAVRAVTGARTLVSLTATGVASVTAEALMTLTIGKGVGATNTTGTTYTVTTGKTLRLQFIRFGCRFTTMATTVTFANTTLRVRAVASGGTLSITSPIVVQDNMAAAANMPTPDSDIPLPADGMEFPAGAILGVSHVGSATTLSQDVVILGYEY